MFTILQLKFYYFFTNNYRKIKIKLKWEKCINGEGWGDSVF